MTSTKNRSLLTGGTLALLAVLFVAVIVLTNLLLRGARLDLTENRLFTLSPGTLEVIQELKEPINLHFFFSDKGTAEAPVLRNYATRVREMLEEIAAKSGGKVRLSVIDPVPFSDDEDRAAAFGLQALPLGNAEDTVYLGLAGTNSTDGQLVVPFFDPEKERFLEYEVAKLIHGLSQPAKPVLGLISSINMAPMQMFQTGQIKPGWAIYRSMRELFDVRVIEATVKTIDPAIKTLVLVHPKALSEDLAYAIDQFVMRGGKLAVFLDPNSESDIGDNQSADPMAAIFAHRSSDLPQLFKAWGIEYDPERVVLDGQYGLTVQTTAGETLRHPAVLGLGQPAMSQDDVITAQLSRINVHTAGAFHLADGSKLKLVPLLHSSDQAMLGSVETIRAARDAQSLFQGFKPTGQTYVMAAHVTGAKLKTAFPDRKDAGHLAESQEDANLVLVADTDLLTDRLWVRVQDFNGQQVADAFANNGDFVINALDNLSGSSALISIRGRATSLRPFATVEALRAKADERFRATEQKLNQQLRETERKLAALQSGKSEDEASVLSPEQAQELQRFRDEKLRIRQELRTVRRELASDIETLGAQLKFLNIALLPVVLTLLVAGIAGWRRRRSRLRAV